jgi:ABC-type transport system substrate-binding protein
MARLPALIISLVLFAPTVQAAEPRPGGVLRFGLSKDITGLHPFQGTRSVNKNVFSIQYECLAAFDEFGNLKPSLATSWEVSKDGLEYTFRLRKGVKFHNGKDMSQEDVRWSIDFARDAKNGAFGRAYLLSVTSLQAIDSHTIKIVLGEPYVPFISTLSTIQAFPVVPKDSLKGGREMMTATPPGTGPFHLVDWKPNQQILFQKFPQYWQKGWPYLDEVIFRPIEDDTVRFTALRTGDFDIAERIPYDQVDRIRKGEIKGLGIEEANAAGYRSVIFNTEKPPTNSVKVRQAIAYTLDKQKLIEGISWGFGIVASQKMLKGSEWFTSIQERTRDLEKAKALLREAGYPNGLKFQAQVEKRTEGEMQMVQSQLKEIGIDLDLEFMDFAKHQQNLQTGNFLLTSQGGSTNFDPDLTYYKYFHTEQGEKKVNNYSRYSNPKLDTLLDEGRKEVNKAKRLKIYQEVLRILHEEIPQLPVGFTPYIFVFRGHVKDFQVDPSGFFFYGQGGLGKTWLEKS